MRKVQTWIWVGTAAVAGLAIGVTLHVADAPKRPPPATRAPQRIVCMAPSITETVFALGAGDRVVGVSDYTTFPPEAKTKPRVGGLSDTNLAAILRLDPDLIVIQFRHRALEETCRRRNIRVVKVAMRQLSSIYADIRKLGGVLGAAERAEGICRRIDADIATVRKRVAGRPNVKAAFVLEHVPGSLKDIFVAGKGSLLTEMIAVARGKNIFDDLDKPYEQVSLAAVVARAPEVIIEPRQGRPFTDKDRERYLKDWQALPNVPAVKDNRVHFITDDYITIPGPRVARIAARLAEVLHPELNHGR